MPGPPGQNGWDVSFVASQYSMCVVIITASRLPFGHRSGFRSEIGTNGYFIRRFRRVARTIRGRNDSSLLAGLASRSNRAKAWNDSAAQKEVNDIHFKSTKRRSSSMLARTRSSGYQRPD